MFFSSAFDSVIGSELRDHKAALIMNDWPRASECASYKASHAHPRPFGARANEPRARLPFTGGPVPREGVHRRAGGRPLASGNAHESARGRLMTGHTQFANRRPCADSTTNRAHPRQLALFLSESRPAGHSLTVQRSDQSPRRATRCRAGFKCHRKSGLQTTAICHTTNPLKVQLDWIQFNLTTSNWPPASSRPNSIIPFNLTYNPRSGAMRLGAGQHFGA